PAAAQWLGEPAWNDPTAGTGFTIYGDYSRPNSNVGGGTAFGGRVALGAGIFTLTGGVASWDPDLVSQRLLSVGGTVGFRVIGGNVGVGPIGIHVAYDSEKFDDGTTHGVFGIGANLGLRP